MGESFPGKVAGLGDGSPPLEIPQRAVCQLGAMAQLTSGQYHALIRQGQLAPQERIELIAGLLHPMFPKGTPLQLLPSLTPMPGLDYTVSRSRTWSLSKTGLIWSATPARRRFSW